MAHFAELDENNIVTRVIVVADEHEADGENWCNELLGGTWKQTSYNTRGGVHYGQDRDSDDNLIPDGGVTLRKNYAGTGFTYDAARDAFISPKPYPSWTLDEDTCQWEAPVTYPDDGKMYKWDEDDYQADNSTGWVQTNLE